MKRPDMSQPLARLSAGCQGLRAGEEVGGGPVKPRDQIAANLGHFSLIIRRHRRALCCAVRTELLLVAVILRMEVKLTLHQCQRSEEHTSELQSLMSTPYSVLCLKQKKA